jgi:hypothetical protein
MIKFQAYPKTPRLNREVVVTEKIDGTNSGIHVVLASEVMSEEREPAIFSSSANMVEYLKIHYPRYQYVTVDGVNFAVAAQSRNRLIFPGKTTDNHGFAGWVYDNAETLVQTLGPGLHIGEWWGRGIQGRYQMDRRVFSLFNVTRWAHLATESPLESLSVVPELWRGIFNTQEIHAVVAELRIAGSYAAPGCMRPEGVIIRHSASGQVYKVLLEGDDVSKTERGVS